MIFLAACAKKHVANLWTEFAAHHVDAMATNGKECKKPLGFLVAATFEKAKTYVFAETLIWDREVGGSNPLAPTKVISSNVIWYRAADGKAFLRVGALKFPSIGFSSGPK